MSSLEEFIDALRMERLRRRIKQLDIANELGIRQAAVCNWERHANLPTSENLRAWASLLGVAVPSGLPIAPRPVAQCGTRSGYQRHRRLNEPYCAACRQANADDHAAWRSGQRAS